VFHVKNPISVKIAMHAQQTSVQMENALILQFQDAPLVILALNAMMIILV
jgi:hypothetical protein